MYALLYIPSIMIYNVLCMLLLLAVDLGQVSTIGTMTMETAGVPAAYLNKVGDGFADNYKYILGLIINDDDISNVGYNDNFICKNVISCNDSFVHTKKS